MEVAAGSGAEAGLAGWGDRRPAAEPCVEVAAGSGAGAAAGSRRCAAAPWAAVCCARSGSWAGSLVAVKPSAGVSVASGAGPVAGKPTVGGSGVESGAAGFGASFAASAGAGWSGRGWGGVRLAVGLGASGAGFCGVPGEAGALPAGGSERGGIAREPSKSGRIRTGRRRSGRRAVFNARPQILIPAGCGPEHPRRSPTNRGSCKPSHTERSNPPLTLRNSHRWTQDRRHPIGRRGGQILPTAVPLRYCPPVPITVRSRSRTPSKPPPRLAHRVPPPAVLGPAPRRWKALSWLHTAPPAAKLLPRH